ncbi:hypothetical protein B0H19DRAFT_69040 [Mycena capillaripes]|nr:hypothetical protein B0H19DRAFT_69040 [Mycena capillaripes]
MVRLHTDILLCTDILRPATLDVFSNREALLPKSIHLASPYKTTRATPTLFSMPIPLAGYDGGVGLDDERGGRSARQHNLGREGVRGSAICCFEYSAAAPLPTHSLSLRPRSLAQAAAYVIGYDLFPSSYRGSLFVLTVSLSLVRWARASVGQEDVPLLRFPALSLQKSIAMLLVHGMPWQQTLWMAKFHKAWPWTAMYSQPLYIPCQWSAIIAITSCSTIGTIGDV